MDKIDSNCCNVQNAVFLSESYSIYDRMTNPYFLQKMVVFVVITLKIMLDVLKQKPSNKHSG